MRSLLMLCTLAAGAGVARTASAQSLTIKRSMPVEVAPGCGVSASGNTGLRRDNADARRLAAEGQEAALAGDRAAARTAFARAAALNPGDDRIAYELGRANEELADTSAAVTEYCRYLVLASEGREAADVRGRLQRLMPPASVTNAQRSAETFRTGVSHFDARRYEPAANAFGETIRRTPPANEALFNRALARSASGRRADAVKDLEAYLISAPAATDRAAVIRAIDVLRRPVYSSGTAFTRGLIPGFGQFYTGRSGRGVAVLLAVAGAGALAAYQKTETKEVPYVDPNGVPVPYTETSTKRPYLIPGLAAGVGLTLAAAFEASRYASSASQRVAQFSPFVDARGGLGVRLAAQF
ncbi:MAG TPA: tetratricopeptide repeat protein [Gemmatimonas sp.]|nr:tetratricopeptide repeat protein [Gemmatimonas sp.]